MEDQQPGAGDLTDDPMPNAGTDSQIEDAGAAEAIGEIGEIEEPAAAATRRPVGKRMVAAVAAAAALFVGAAGFAGAAVQPYLADRAVVAIKLDVARTATTAINALWNYTPEDMDTLLDRASSYLSGDLQAEYRKFIDAIAESNKQAKITTSTQITGAAVESLDGPAATVIVFTTTTATSDLRRNLPSLKYLSYRMSMQRDHGRWVVTAMPAITSLNVTPQL